LLQCIVLHQSDSSLSQTDYVLHIWWTEGNELLLHKSRIQILLYESHHPLVNTLQFQQIRCTRRRMLNYSHRLILLSSEVLIHQKHHLLSKTILSRLRIPLLQILLQQKSLLPKVLWLLIQILINLWIQIFLQKVYAF